MNARCGSSGVHPGGVFSLSARLSILSGLLASFFVISGGCAIIPHRHPSTPVINEVGPEAEVDSLASITMGPPDSLARVVVEPSMPSRPRSPRSGSVPSTPVQEPPSQLASPPPEDEPGPSISVEMPNSDRERFEASYRTDIELVDRAIRRFSEDQLPQGDMDKLQTAKGLVSQSNAAFEQQDLQAAANLAHKARVLVEEIASH